MCLLNDNDSVVLTILRGWLRSLPEDRQPFV